MSTESTGLSEHGCHECVKRQDMIEKYSQLVHLLKKKTQKQEGSLVKESTISQLTQSRSSAGYPLPALTLLPFLDKLLARRLQTAFGQLRLDSRCLLLPFMSGQPIIKQPRCSAGPLGTSQVHHTTRDSTTAQTPTLSTTQLSSSAVLAGFLESEFKLKGSPKFLLHKIWWLSRQRAGMEARVGGLERELEESVRRQEREIAKKRESLQGLAEELGEKNEMIEELKETIKSLEVKLGTRDNQMLQRLLEEDGESLRRVIYQLENVNDKLNHQVAKIKNQKIQIDANNKQLAAEVEQLKMEVERMKEQLFEGEHQTQQNQLLRRQLEIMQQKVEAKMVRVRRDEKKNNNLRKMRSNSVEEGQEEPISINYNQTIMKLQQKIECIFGFLFNIEHKVNSLSKPQLFDEEESELLLTHHQRYLSALRADLFTPPASHKHILLNGKEQDALFGDSFLQAFEEKGQTKKQGKKENMRMLELQLQRNGLIERISELKERHLHMRCVILQLLKSLQLRAMKKQTEAILSVLCDFFEYSQDERNAILQTRAKKFFGLL